MVMVMETIIKIHRIHFAFNTRIHCFVYSKTQTVSWLSRLQSQQFYGWLLCLTDSNFVKLKSFGASYANENL